MSFRGMLRPGQGFKKFKVLRQTSKTTSSGRVQAASLSPVGEIYGIKTRASQKEIEQWKQKGHPISHTIVQRGTKNCAKATDFLELGEGDAKRRFYVQGTRNPGELGHFTVYMVEEREDLQ